jgi:hypothetical protein
MPGSVGESFAPGNKGVSATQYQAERGCVEDQPQQMVCERCEWFEATAAGSASLRSSEHSRAPQISAFFM